MTEPIPLEAVIYLIVGALAWAVGAVVLRYLHRLLTRNRYVTLHGPAVTPELQRLFSTFGPVEGIIAWPRGLIEVHYKDGTRIEFVPRVIE